VYTCPRPRVYITPGSHGVVIDVVSDACRLYDTIRDGIWLTYTAIPVMPMILARYRSPGLSPASGFEHPASPLPTRFPAALDIGYGLPAA